MVKGRSATLIKARNTPCISASVPVIAIEIGVMKNEMNTLTKSIKIRKDVPQRGWNLRCFFTFSTVSSRPAS